MKESENSEILENSEKIDTNNIKDIKDLSETSFDENFKYDYQFGEESDFEIVDHELNSYGLSKNEDGVYQIEETYVNKKYVTDYVWMALMKISEKYGANRDNNQLPLFEVVDKRNTCIVLLNGRMNALADSGRKNMKEYQECAFLRKALANGWTPTDIFLLSQLYELVDKTTVGNDRKMGLNILHFLSEIQLQTVEERLTVLRDIADFSKTIHNREEKIKFERLLNASLNINPLPTEYATDENFAEFFKKNGYLNPNQQMRHGSPSENYLDLLSSATMYMGLSDNKKQRVRGKKDYVMSKLKEDEMEHFNITTGHTHNHITKSNRNALKEVFGDEIYDDIDEMHRGDVNDRTVKIYHSLGNKYLQKGEEVLEIDFAGSGFKEARREYNGQHGKKFSDGTRNTQDAITMQYGDLVLKPGSKKTYSHLRAKNTYVDLKNGKKMTKTRYSIAGPTPDLIFKPGALNVGEYSIENTRVYGKNFAAKFLTPLFQKAANELKTAEDMKDIHIHVTGHSRGAVASSESVKLMNKWVEEYENTHPECKGYSDRVKYKQILRDPVPGIFTKWFHGSVDLRSVKNLDTTLFCSMAQEHYDINFPLQNVRGAQRIIIGTTDHGMELGSTDSSQVLQKGDGKAHLAGFYDSETGEYFRGSGLTEIPDGVYIADDNYNLIRITSYSQLAKVIDAVYAGNSKQGRVDTIHKMVRNWFLDNELKMSFVDEDAYENAKIKNQDVVDKIMVHNNSRLDNIKAAINDLNEYKNQMIQSEEELIAHNNRIIKACREYMKKTSIPTSRTDSTYRMDMVSDLLSFCMRENNQYKAELAKIKGEPENELDAKIRKQRQRMEAKPGALDRKLENEMKRIERDESVVRMINQTVKFCEDTVGALKETRKNKNPSSAYKAYMDVIKEGEQLGADNISVLQFKKFLKKLKKVAYNYSDGHTMFGDPSSTDGQTRVKWADDAVKFATSTLKNVNKVSRYMADRDVPVGKVIQERKEKAESLKSKGAGINNNEDLNKSTEIITTAPKKVTKKEEKKSVIRK